MLGMYDYKRPRGTRTPAYNCV